MRDLFAGKLIKTRVQDCLQLRFQIQRESVTSGSIGSFSLFHVAGWTLFCRQGSRGSTQIALCQVLVSDPQIDRARSAEKRLWCFSVRTLVLQPLPGGMQDKTGMIPGDGHGRMKNKPWSSVGGSLLRSAKGASRPLT